MSTASHESASLDQQARNRNRIASDVSVSDDLQERRLVGPDDDFSVSEDDPGQDDPGQDEAGEDYSSYRTLSAAAVVSCVFGIASLLTFLDWWLAVLPLAGLAIGLIALRQIAARSDELTGRLPAAIGVALSLLGLICGQAWLWYVHITEVPDGHVRMSYSDLQPPERSLVPVPDSAREFDGKRVFIKGYVLAGNRKDGIRTFILVRDKGDCCFGGNPKLTDRILVQLKPGHFFSYTDRVQKLAGKFQIRPGQAVDVAGEVVYQLDDAEIL